MTENHDLAVWVVGLLTLLIFKIGSNDVEVTSGAGITFGGFYTVNIDYILSPIESKNIHVSP